MGAPAIHIPRLEFYNGRTNDIHPWTHIQQQAHQRYALRDSYSTVGTLAIYIPGFAFHSERSSDIHSWTQIPLSAHQRYTFLDSRTNMGTPAIYAQDSYPTVVAPAIYNSRLESYGRRTDNIHSWTRILQLAHQGYTSLDLHSTAGTPLIYNRGLTSYGRRASITHSWTHILQ